MTITQIRQVLFDHPRALYYTTAVIAVCRWAMALFGLAAIPFGLAGWNSACGRFLIGVFVAYTIEQLAVRVYETIRRRNRNRSATVGYRR